MNLTFSPSKLTKKGERFIGSADAAVLPEIAAQLNILSVENLSWELIAKPWGRKGFRLDGKIKGTVAQACIMTLAAVSEQIEETIDLRFVPEESLKDKPRNAGNEEDVHFDASPEEEPEIYAGDSFDALPFVIEYLALGLNPYPRAPGAAFTDIEVKAEDGSALTRALQAWADKKPG